ncbi:MAG: apolipoprotein N-acyltransferase [Acidimicrobiia bacterium]|nr:apolipoprotein N-acyltransferase [Acidimicrobiia bacterium]
MPSLPKIPWWGGAILAGIGLAGSLPPWGWWPLAFLGIAGWDHLTAEVGPSTRFVRSSLIAATWLTIAMFWMIDLTVLGFILAVLAYSAYFGVAGALTPTDRPQRFVVFPIAIVVAELVRWRFPFGGVPLANIALSQVETPLAQTARIGGPYLIIGLVVLVGLSLRELVTTDNRRLGLIGLGVVVGFTVLGILHPRASDIGELDVALVQGGGATRTRASGESAAVVLGRHVETTRYLDQPVDLVLWPENVVNPGRFFSVTDAEEVVAGVAERADATLLSGWFYRVNDPDGDGVETVNYQAVTTADGEEIDRYDKVRIVPFGEFVPLRGLIEVFSSDIPNADVRAGTGPAVVTSPEGVFGVNISWEAYFERRSRDAIAHGAEVLTNPTNGASYWLSLVHTQQVASNQLRAIEGDRWLLMAAPTGMSAIVSPDGDVIQRSDLGERIIMTESIQRREGRTLFSYLGVWPVLLYVVAIAGWRLRRFRPRGSG